MQSPFAKTWQGSTLASLGVAVVPFSARNTLELTEAQSRNVSVLSQVTVVRVDGGTKLPGQHIAFWLFLPAALALQCFMFCIGF